MSDQAPVGDQATIVAFSRKIWPSADTLMPSKFFHQPEM
jgi:hypothetical protein